MSNDQVRGRGAAANPLNRFELLRYEPDLDAPVDERPGPATQFFNDVTRSLITTNDSPDIPYETSINPYRGCEHGCIYCYARPYHEYLGFSAGLDFESKILVKREAPQLLRRELASPRWKPQLLAISGVTDCYQPVERRLKLTRGCLEVLAEFRNPVSVITKNHLVSRDRDILAELAKHDAAVVYISLTTLDADLARRMEPRASAPAARLAAIRELSDAGVPVGAMLGPVIPALTDHEIPALLAAAKEAGARYAGYVVLRLPHAVAELFPRWLEQHFPDKKDKVLGRLRDIRQGKLNDPDFATRMRGDGVFAEMIEQVFKKARTKAGLDGRPRLSTAAFRRPNETPQALFE